MRKLQSLLLKPLLRPSFVYAQHVECILAPSSQWSSRSLCSFFLILRSGIKKIPASTYSCEAYIYPLQLFFLCLHLYFQINRNLYFVYDLQHLKKFQTKHFTLKNKNKTLNCSLNKKFSNDRAKFCRLTNAAVQIPLVSKYTQTCKNNKLFKETKINKLNHFFTKFCFPFH